MSQVGERYRVLARQAVLWPQPHQERLRAEYLVRDSVGCRDQAAGDDYIDAAGGQGVGQRGQPHPLHVHGYLRRPERETADEVRGQRRRHRRGDAEPHRARVPAGHPAGEQGRAQFTLEPPEFHT